MGLTFRQRSSAALVALCAVVSACAGGSEESDAYVAAEALTSGAGTLAVLAGQPWGGGNVDGPGSAARFFHPQAVAVDGSGNVYVADRDNHTIRKITPAGVVSTLAGLAGQAGSADGTGSAARFDSPQGVAVDGAGDVYVADSGNHTIRKVTPAGQVSTLGGLAGQAGSADGTGSAARFGSPQGVAVDGAGNVYVADSGNHAIRKVTPAGQVSTLAGSAGSSGSGDGTGSAARFDWPRGVAVDGAGNVHVADSGNHTIRKVTPAGVVSTLAGLAGAPANADGTGSAARFYGPSGVAVDGPGNVYVADTLNCAIRKISPAGEVSTLAGRFSGSEDGPGDTARLTYPTGVAVDGAGFVYVADQSNLTIRKITPAGEVSTLAGRAGSFGSADGTGSVARFYMPGGVAVDGSGNVYVADSGNHTIRKVTPAGVVSTLAGSAGQAGSADGTGSAARFLGPSAVAADAFGNVYVADSSNQTIRKITPGGEVSTLAGSAGQPGSADGIGSAARFSYPRGVAVDGFGNVYVADTNNHTIRKITIDGEVSTLAGSAGSFGSADGTGSAARFRSPYGVAVDGEGHAYVADYANQTIRKVTPAGEVSTLAGSAGSFGSADGTGPSARFFWPRGLAVDGAGNVYVADYENHSIRKITPAGAVSTIVGAPRSMGTVPGALPASLAWPSGVAVSAETGNLFIAVDHAVLVASNRSNQLTVRTAGTGAGSVLSEDTFPAIDCAANAGQCSGVRTGATVTLVAEPASIPAYPGAGWSVVSSWSGCASVSADKRTCTVSMTAAKTVTVTFQLVTLTVRTAGSGAGSVRTAETSPTLDCAANAGQCTGVPVGGAVTLTAFPAEGSYVASWSGCASTSADKRTCTVSMTAANIVTATFRPLALTVRTAGTGAGSVRSEDTTPAIDCAANAGGCTGISAGGMVTLVAEPGQGSYVASWSGCSSISADKRTCTVSMTAAKIVTAVFQPFTVTVRTAGTGAGSVRSEDTTPAIDCAANAGQCSGVRTGATVTLVAEPASIPAYPGAGWSVVSSWSGCASVSADKRTCTVSMTAAKTVTVTFQLVTLTVRTAGSGAGSVRTAETSPTLDCAANAGQCTGVPVGAAVTLTASPAEGSYVASWSGCASTSADKRTCTVVMTAAKFVTAVFQPLTVTVRTAGTGAGSVRSEDTTPAIDCAANAGQCTGVASGATVTLVAEPAAGSFVRSWSGCGSFSADKRSCIVQMAAARTVTASFAQSP